MFNPAEETWKRNRLSLEVGRLLLAVSKRGLRSKLAARAIRHHLVVEKTWKRRRRSARYLIKVLTRLYDGKDDLSTTIRRLALLYAEQKKGHK